MRPTAKEGALIYHIVPMSELITFLQGDVYTPPSLAEHGFVHCALEPSVLPVSNDLFAATSEQLLLLAIDPAKLSSVVRYEAPAPIAGGGVSHLEGDPVFPHVYGPINRQAIVGAGVLERTPDGYRWPRELVPLATCLEQSRDPV